MSMKSLVRSGLSLMGLEKRSNPLENPSTPLGQGMDYLLYLLAGEPTASGEAISEHTAMQISVVYACVGLIARDVGSLPLYVYDRTKSGHKRVDDTNLADLLNVEPHPDMSPASFKEAVTANICLCGNGYAEITWDGNGQAAFLTPRLATRTTPIRLLNGDLAYRCTDTDSNGRIVASEDMLHIPALALDGILGMNPIRQMRQALGLATAAEKAAARLFGNGMLSTGILTMPTGMSAEQKIQLKKSFEESASGKNQQRPIVVPADAKYVPLSINPADSQFIETRKYSAEELCRIWGVPPHKIGILERATNNNIEHQGIEYVTSTLRPYLVRWEQEIQRKLIPRIGRNAGRYFVRFDVSELLRGDQASTSAYYSASLQWGWLNKNEVREREGLNSIGPQGDIYLSPLNMVNAETLLDKPVDPLVNKPDDLVPLPTPGTQQPTDPSEDQPDSTVGDDTRMIERYAGAYKRLFRDAMGRLLARDARDANTIHRLFDPVLTTIAETSITDANRVFRTKVPASIGTELVTDYLRSMEKRTAKWNSTDPDALSTLELNKAIKAIVIGVYREAGACVVLGDSYATV